MGERSQMYITTKVKAPEERLNDAPDNRLTALYFQWNYGINAIMRLESVISYLDFMIQQNYPFAAPYKGVTPYFAQVVSNEVPIYASMNFYTRLRETPVDIMKLYFEDNANKKSCRDVFMNMDNNDGQFYIHVDEQGHIKYAIVSYDDYACNDGANKMFTPLTAQQYLEEYPLEILKGQLLEGDNEFLLMVQNEESYEDALNKSIARIEQKATLMTPEELHDIICADYSYEFETKGYAKPKEKGQEIEDR